jgi:phosphatidylinositol dimannoside acyltransferase
MATRTGRGPTGERMGFEPVSAGYKTASAFVRTVPREVSTLSAEVASRIAIEVSPERRLLVERNLQRVYGPSYTGAALRRSVLATFRSYSRYWIDSFRLPDLPPARIDAGFAFDGVGQIFDARARGIGPILVMPHLGGWEWAGFWLTRVLGLPVTVVVEAVEPPELFDFFTSYREGLGLKIVTLGPNAGGEVLRAIKDRHVVCLLADRDIAGDGLPVDFFGEQTTMPAGPATLAVRTGAPLLPTAVYFEGRGHHAIVGKPVSTERQGRFRDDVARITQELADRLEAFIRTAPEQWHLQQPNWPSDYDALEAIGKPVARPGALVATR